MKKVTTMGLICLKDKHNFVYRIAKIAYIEWEDGHFKYVFTPYYNIIDMLPTHLFQGIPGLDLALRRACYEREDIVPTFISERSPSEGRENYWDIMAESGERALDRLDWLIKTNKKYSGDNFFVTHFEEPKTIKLPSMFDLAKRSDLVDRELLKIICYGDNLYTSEIVINNATRAQYYKFLMSKYEQKAVIRKDAQHRGIVHAKLMSTYHGREEIRIDPLLFDEVVGLYESRVIGVDEACKRLGVSRSTFFRRLRRSKI